MRLLVLMKIKDVLQMAIKMGIEADPRGQEGINKLLDKTKEDYDKLEGRDKEVFDTQRLENPFGDSRHLYGDLEKDVKKVMVGIDITTGEVLLADRLNERGKKIDLIIGHHPRGIGLSGLHDVMHLQKNLLAEWGIPINVAESLMDERIQEIERKVKGANFNQSVDAARLLDIPLICVHTPADNLVNEFLTDKIEENELDTVKDVIDMLNEIPEYHEGRKLGDGPCVFVGKEDRSAGKVVVEMTGGTQGSKKSYEKLSHVGVGTLIGMHLSDEHRKEVEKHHMNYVIAGHMSSDSLGLNLFLDGLEKEGIDIIHCSGFTRHSRV